MKFMDAVLGTIKGVNDSLSTRAAALEARIEVLERGLTDIRRQPTLEYTGTWQEGTTYERGQMVTHQGSVWYCKRPAATRPNEDPERWQLMVKRGRDGRDAR